MTKRPNPLDRYALDITPGELTWIGVRPKRREPLQSVASTKAVATLGLEGDHRMGKTPGSGRQVSIISLGFCWRRAAGASCGMGKASIRSCKRHPHSQQCLCATPRTRTTQAHSSALRVGSLVCSMQLVPATRACWLSSTRGACVGSVRRKQWALGTCSALRRALPF